MGRILELVGGPPASGKTTYIRNNYGNRSSREFVHLDFDAMVVREVARMRLEVREQEIRDHVGMVYGRERATVMYGDSERVTVDWPFCISKRAEEYISIGRKTGRLIECNFITTRATEAWTRALTRHVAGEYNAFTVFCDKEIDIAEALRPTFKIFLEAHRDMPASVERVFPQADEAYLWDNNERDATPVIIAHCRKGEDIEIVDKKGWDNFQYKRKINIYAYFEVLGRHVEEYLGKPRTIFNIKYNNLIHGRDDKVFLI